MRVILSIAFVAAFLAVTPASAQTANLFANPSVETASGSVPASWTSNKWGTTVATFTYPSTGAQSGTRYVKTQITTAGTGDAKWSPNHVAVAPGQTLTFSNYYQSSVQSFVEIEYKLTSGTFQYVRLAALPAAAAWTQYQTTFVVPANMQSLTVYHFIQAVGTLSVDNYSLTGNGSTPVVTKPVISSFTATPTSIPRGQSTRLSWVVSPAASTTISINQGVGAVVGTTSVMVSPTVTTTYTLTATNSAGVTTATRSVTVTQPPAPTISAFTATPTSIVVGNKTKLAWTTSNATSLSINKGVGTVTGTTSISVSPTTTTAYILTAGNGLATTTATRTVTVTAPPKPTISAFTATPATVALGSSTRLAWTVTGAVSLSINQGVGTVTGTSTVVTPATTTVYTLTAVNAAGTTTATRTVTVTRPAKPTVSAFTATPATVALGSSTRLAWTVTPAGSTLSISPGVGVVTGTSTLVTPATTTVYTLTASNISGTTTATRTVTVVAPPAPTPKPTISSFTANPASVIAGSPTTLLWSVSNASSTSIQGVGTVAGNSTSVTPATTTSYVLVATNPGGSTYATTTVAVTAAPTDSNIILNPSFETENGTLPSNWSNQSWGTNNAAFTYVKNAGRTGTHSAKVDITTYTDGDAKWMHNATPVTPGDSYRFSDWYQATTETYVVVDFTLTDNTHYYLGLRAAPASVSWRQYTETFAVPYNAKSMAVYHLLMSTGSLAVDDYSLTKITPQGFSRGVVTVAFDDGWEEDVFTVLPVLKNKGLPATFFFATSFLESTPTTGPINESGKQAILAMQADGHEIGGHSVTHPDLTTLTPANLDYELRHSKEYLESIAGVGQVRNLATPYGTYNAAVIAKAQELYASLRSTDEGYNNKEDFDQYRLKVQNMQVTTTLTQFQSWVDQAKKDKSWLVLVYHRVATSSLTQYDTPEANFEPEMQYLKNSGVAVLTADQALQEILPQLGIVVPPPPPPTVVKPTIQSFAVSPATVEAGQSAMLSWNIANASSTSIDQGIGIVTGTTKSITPATTTTYTITATNPGGSVSAQATVTVTVAPPPPPPPPQTTNLIANPTFLSTTTQGAGVRPTSWNTGAWGAAAGAVFSYPVSGIDDAAGAEVSLPSYAGTGTGNGAAQWFFDTVPVTGGTFYSFSDSYKSDTTSYMVVQWLLANGSAAYEPVTTLPATGGVWKTTSQYFTAPTNATGMTILHQIQSVGTLTVDNYSLTASVPSAAESMPKATVTLAFDDGLATQYENALPLLKAASLPASFYIVTDRMAEASYYDFFTDPNQAISVVSNANGITWNEIYLDPTERNYRFFDKYTASGISTLSVSYNLNGTPTTQVVGTMDAGTDAQGGFAFELPTNSNGNTVSPISISHTSAGSLSISQPSLIPYSMGYMTKRQVLDLAAAGQEVGVHTKTHPDLASLNSSQVLSEIDGARSALLALNVSPVTTIAYPYGSYNSSIVQIAQDTGLLGGRSVDIGYNSTSADKFALKTNSVNTPTSFATVKSWIDTAMQNKLWLVLTFHNVDTQAKLAEIGDPYGTTPEILQQIVSYLAAQQGAGALDVKTLNAALALLQ